MQVIADSQIQVLTGLIAEYLPLLRERIFVGVYADISPNWYKFVGSKFFTTLVILSMVLLAKTMAVAGINLVTRKRAHLALTQPDMNTYAAHTALLTHPSAASTHVHSHQPQQGLHVVAL
jgi:hypothetical protein